MSHLYQRVRVFSCSSYIMGVEALLFEHGSKHRALLFTFFKTARNGFNLVFFGLAIFYGFEHDKFIAAFKRREPVRDNKAYFSRAESIKIFDKLIFRKRVKIGCSFV